MLHATARYFAPCYTIRTRMYIWYCKMGWKYLVQRSA